MSNVKKLPLREEIPQEYKWNVEKIYKDIETWEKDFEDLKKYAVKAKEYQGKLGDKSKFIEYLKLNEDINRKTEKLFIYAHLKSDEDTGNNKYMVLKDKIDTYIAELSSYGAFFVPEILSLDDSIINSYLNDEELKLYKFLLEDILKEKPHVLTKDMEELLAQVSDCLDAPDNIYNTFTNADMTFGEIKNDEGNTVELTEGNYSSFIRSKNREVRKNAFEKLFGSYRKYENTLGVMLTSSVKNDVFASKIRKYNSSLEASLKPNNIPVEVYTNAIDTINKNLSSLHRYVKLKKKMLGLDEMHMYDLYAPLFDVPKEHIEYKEAVEIVKTALQPLGKEYLDIFSEGIESGWIDVYENKGKRGGAYSWGSYDTMPYVLLNYNYDINDVSTLAHEMGHSLHSYYSRKEQPYIYSGYTLFCAEVASTTNEILLITDLINKEEDRLKRLHLINTELEQIRTTVFRQLMFAEFELKVHESIESGEPLAADNLNNIWYELNKKYFGEDIVIDEEIKIEWARISHFYSDFYVYQYATGYAAASAFANSILENGEEAVEKYKGFLKSGGSDYPIEILKKAGVDMTTSEPLEATVKRFNSLLNMLEAEL